MNRKLLSLSMAIVFMAAAGAVAMAADQPMGQQQQMDERRDSVIERGGQERDGMMQDRESGAAVSGDMDREELMESRQDAEEAVQMSADVIREVTSPDLEERIPDSLLQQAQGVVIVPSVVKAGLIAGGRFGRGVLVTKNQDQWSLPVIVTIGGASVGAQIGVEESDLIMVFNDRAAIQNLIEDSDFTLGVDASVAAGEAGAKAKAVATEADVVTYKRAEGLFAGVSLTGGVLDVDEDAMMAYYRMDDPEVRAYYGEDEAQMAQKVLNAGQQDQKIMENVPQSAKNLQDTMSQITSARK